MNDKKEGNVFLVFADIFKTRVKENFNIDLSDEQIEKAFLYGHLLLEWNKKINLTAITEPAEIITKHFLDSLVFVKWIKYFYKEQRVSLADLGTGAGFPGILIKIIQPEMNVTLIDSLAKRLHFLKQVIISLELENIETCHARAEDIGRDHRYRETFDVVTARAVAELPVLVEYSIPLLKVEGRLLAAKGLEPVKEITSSKKAFQVLNCKVEHLDKYSLGEGADHRSLVIITKTGKTSSNYPRQAGKPKRNPL